MLAIIITVVRIEVFNWEFCKVAVAENAPISHHRHSAVSLSPLLVISTKYVHIKSTTVYVPSSELGLSHPLSRQRVCPYPRNQGGGAHSPAGEGLGASNYNDWSKSLALCLLCGHLSLWKVYLSAWVSW